MGGGVKRRGEKDGEGRGENDGEGRGEGGEGWRGEGGGKDGGGSQVLNRTLCNNIFGHVCAYIPVGVGLWHSSTGEWGSWKIPPVNKK